MRGFLEKVKRYKTVLIMLIVFTSALYSFFMINQLTNDFDGLWNQSYYIAGDVETSSGRWLWPYLDMFQQGLHVEPINTVIAISIYALSFVLVLTALDLEGSIIAGIAGLIIMSSPILSVALSYRFMAVDYALACFTASFSVYACVKAKKDIWAVIISAILLSLSLAMYQSYLSVFCVTGLFSIVVLLTGGTDIKSVINRVIRLFSCVLAGGVLYFITLKIVMKLRGNVLSDYNGVGDISVASILLSLPKSMTTTYEVFKGYVAGNTMKLSTITPKASGYLFNGVLILLLIVLLVWKALKEKENRVPRMILLVLCLLLMPVACNVANLLAPEAGFQPQMGYGLLLFAALAVIFVYEIAREAIPNLMKYSVPVFAIVLCLIVYGQSTRVLLDHSAMKEGYDASITLANGIIRDLESKDLLLQEKQYFFIGVPAHNETFLRSEVYNNANYYAQVGNFVEEGTNVYASYKALINRVLGVNITLLSDSYESKAYDEYYKSVPTYPHEGYIVNFDTVIIKVSEP